MLRPRSASPLSHDEGKTWPKQERYTLRDDLQNVDNGYPVSTELPDGRILSVYYYNLFERFVIAGNIYHLPKTERR
jgi:sialidase-1